MTFKVAYCKEFNGNITAYKAKREYFAQDDSKLKYSFHCPDENCNVELVGVNIYALGGYKNDPHFRTKQNIKHIPDCFIIKETQHSNSTVSKSSEESSFDYFGFPTEFILERPKKEASSPTSEISDYDDDYDVKPRRKAIDKEARNTHAPNKTSYLENVVDVYEQIVDTPQAQTHFIRLNNERRSYKNTFKNIRYFEDGKNFIFHGSILPIKPYGKDYSIKFEDKAKFNHKYYPVTIYITDELISKYRMSRLFRESIDKLVGLGDAFKSATCYFVGAYPELKTVTLKNSSNTFDVLEVKITNLDHFVIKFTE